VVESADGVVEFQVAGGRPPKMVLWVHAVAAMCATPLLIVEGLRYRRQVATTDIAFDQQLGSELVGAGRRFDRRAVELSGRECIEDSFVASAGRGQTRTARSISGSKPAIRPGATARTRAAWGTSGASATTSAIRALWVPPCGVSGTVVTSGIVEGL
jgi:hypothetical protein